MADYEDVVVRMELPAQLEMLYPLSAFLGELLVQWRPNVSRKSTDDISLIVAEAFTNVCIHAYQPEDRGMVVVDIRLKGLQINVSFEDTGKTFDEANWKAPDLDAPLESGRGVWLMKQLSDEFIYTSSPGEKNTLTLVKQLQVPARDES